MAHVRIKPSANRPSIRLGRPREPEAKRNHGKTNDISINLSNRS